MTALFSDKHCALFTRRKYACGQVIVTRSAKDRNVYLILSGQVRVTVYSRSGKEVSFRDLYAGNAFGEISAIDGLPRSANVEAVTDCTVALLPSEQFWRLMKSDQDVMVNVVRQLAATIRSLSDRLFELTTLGVQNRVHAEVLRLAKDAGVEKNRAVIAPTPRHADIARRISANREQVTKELSAMVRTGIVLKREQTLVVPDVERLERIVRDAAG